MNTEKTKKQENNKVPKKIGVALNRHAPPHAGHAYMCGLAMSYVGADNFYVGVCTGDKNDPIPGELRVKWTKEILPDVHVVQCDQMVKKYDMDYDDHELWGMVIKDHLGLEGKVGFVFASEDYGKPIADSVGAKYVPIDKARDTVPVSGTAVRENPMENWKFLPDPVKPYFEKRVCVIGAGHTGKEELSRTLAKAFDTYFVHEFADNVYDPEEHPCAKKDLANIALGQISAEDALEKMANKVLISDTDAFTTRLWYDEVGAKCPEWLEKESDRREYDLYLFVPTEDLEFTPGNTHDTREKWDAFSQRIETALQETGRDYVKLTGNTDQRAEQAIGEVNKLIYEHPQPKTWTPRRLMEAPYRPDLSEL